VLEINAEKKVKYLSYTCKLIKLIKYKQNDTITLHYITY